MVEKNWPKPITPPKKNTGIGQSVGSGGIKESPWHVGAKRELNLMWLLWGVRSNFRKKRRKKKTWEFSKPLRPKNPDLSLGLMVEKKTAPKIG